MRAVFSCSVGPTCLMCGRENTAKGVYVFHLEDIVLEEGVS